MALHEAQRRQLEAVVRRIEMIPENVPIVLAGDFNAPTGDGIYRVLKPRLRDAFAEAGSGLGNTVTSSFPALRIDQVWVSRLKPLKVVTLVVPESDHRGVLCDLRTSGSRPEGSTGW
jgi:endonuclease/exonuclease/phosphatase (EEP) superfamily protein YafD